MVRSAGVDQLDEAPPVLFHIHDFQEAACAQDFDAGLVHSVEEGGQLRAMFVTGAGDVRPAQVFGDQGQLTLAERGHVLCRFRDFRSQAEDFGRLGAEEDQRTAAAGVFLEGVHRLRIQAGAQAGDEDDGVLRRVGEVVLGN